MTRGQLAKLPGAEGRRAERRIVNIAASLREPGASLVDAEIQNLSTDGFMAETDGPLEPGAELWLRLPGLELQKSEVVWVDGNRAGFRFAAPLHEATLATVIKAAQRPVLRNHFGPAGMRR